MIILKADRTAETYNSHNTIKELDDAPSPHGSGGRDRDSRNIHEPCATVDLTLKAGCIASVMWFIEDGSGEKRQGASGRRLRYHSLDLLFYRD